MVYGRGRGIEPDVSWRAAPENDRQGFTQLLDVGRTKDLHPRDPSHEREVFECLVRWAVAIRKEAGHCADQCYRQPGNSYVGPDEFESTEGQEGCQRVHDGQPPPQSEPGGSTHHRLLRDTDVDKPVSQLCRQ